MNTIAIPVCIAVISIFAAIRALTLDPKSSGSLKESVCILILNGAITFSLFRVIAVDGLFMTLLAILNLYVYYYGLRLLKNSLIDYLMKNFVTITSSKRAVEAFEEKGIELENHERNLILYQGVYFWLIDEMALISVSGYPLHIENDEEYEIIDAGETIHVGSFSYKVMLGDDGHIHLEEIIVDPLLS